MRCLLQETFSRRINCRYQELCSKTSTIIRKIRLNLTFEQVRSKAKLLHCFKVNMTQPNIKHRLKTQREEN